MDKNVYYSVPRKHLKLVLEKEIDPAEYDRLIQFPEEEPLTPAAHSPPGNAVEEEENT
jgi:hypothetical protein